PPTLISTLSLHDALPICRMNPLAGLKRMFSVQALVELIKALAKFLVILAVALLVLSVDQDDLLAIANEPVEPAILHSLKVVGWRSEEHTSELQSRENLVC